MAAAAAKKRKIGFLDDVLVRRSKRLTLALRVLNPMAYFEEVEASG
jgi:hypothetical protein